MLIALLGLSLFIMNMEEKENINCGDYRLFIGGKEITTFASVDLAVPGSDTSVISEVVSHNGELTFTGTISFSKKDIYKIKKLFKGKKRCLPRKLKKRLKKERENNKAKYLEFWLHFLTNSYKPQIQIDRLDVNKIIADLNKEVSKLIVSPVPTLPRDPGNRPNFIIYDDLE